MWGIEMNAARYFYLGKYSRIDSIDQQIKNCCLNYPSYKYWHAPMLHATGIGDSNCLWYVPTVGADGNI